MSTLHSRVGYAAQPQAQLMLGAGDKSTRLRLTTAIKSRTLRSWVGSAAQPQTGHFC
ncbi:hypothetical protein QEH59_06120 [Coraliomargarita sp. SDUM461004]|uniref:Uncharacterized protein n=1 Tax=Thalassobacterium sedimentorum TaxID=3041258 RepID=A0ABU1AGM9_9BACT|nr:hypothetical protein [Coraliomargarita sp. SDUM461004]MDQ8193991.1 hypothetical protein [Coraliomargarita sp. SDUM461004]